ncbi:uncharacterized protein LOC134690928 isoform X1 [Mytilus trossulus]|uniref:uncharacterized protein LOC134690928 isoform X1 n=1 Tax=Mytilus trossulus TaxID=6551 RepID=UPI0030076F45
MNTCITLFHPPLQHSKEIPLKVFSGNRMIRKGIMASSYSDLIEKCKEKFMVDSNIIRLVLDADGVEVDHDFFRTLEGNTLLMLLTEDEQWMPADNNFTQNVDRQPSHERVTLKSEEEKMIAMIDKLKEKVKKRKLEPARLDRELNNTPSSSNLKFHCGWKHFSFASNVYKQVKVNSRKLKVTECVNQVIYVKQNATYDEVIQKLTDKYYPCGRSKKGPLHKMTLNLGSFTETINPEKFSALKYYNDRKTSEARIYLLSKEKIHDMLAITDSESDELEDFSLFPGIPTTSAKSSPDPESRTLGKPMGSSAVIVPSRPSILGTPIGAYGGTSIGATVGTPIGATVATPIGAFGGTPIDATVGTPIGAFGGTPIDATVGTPISAFGGTPIGAFGGTPIDATVGTPIGATDPTPSASLTTKRIVFHADTPTVTFSYDRRCQICVDRERDSYLSPCGHTFCLVCALQVEEMGQNCPSCRGEIDKVCSIFL